MAEHPSIADIRKSYQKKQLNEADVDSNPITQFEKWWQDAISSAADEVNAMTLATCDAHGRPSARIVLLKGIQDDGFVFFTNYESRKSAELSQNPYVALVFFWKELERQVRVEGRVEKLDCKSSDIYFNSRPRESRIGAWTSPQSSVIASREVLEEKEHILEKEFEGKEIPRPDFWGGFIVRPQNVEFWQGRPGRLHDRLRYRRDDATWIIERLAP